MFLQTSTLYTKQNEFWIFIPQATKLYYTNCVWFDVRPQRGSNEIAINISYKHEIPLGLTLT